MTNMFPKADNFKIFVILTPTTSTSIATTYNNGLNWYNFVGKSFGFAANSNINLFPVDTNTGVDRLSWNIDNGFGG